jgi:hypothetical protein
LTVDITVANIIHETIRNDAFIIEPWLAPSANTITLEVKTRGMLALKIKVDGAVLTITHHYAKRPAPRRLTYDLANPSTDLQAIALELAEELKRIEKDPEPTFF